MKYHQPYGVSDPNAPYINGNPATGTMGSIPPAASIEYPQREIVNLISDANMTPDDGDLHQLAKAIQSGATVFGDDGGTVNQLVVTLKPAVDVLVKGMIIVTIAANTNTGPSTLKVNSLAPLPIVHSVDRTELNALDINQGQMNAFGFDGTKFQLVWSGRVPGAPTWLTGVRDYYIDAVNGNDSYDGLGVAFTTGIHGPFRTLQKASNQIPLFNLNGYGITMHVAPGTYDYMVQQKANGSGFIQWIGNPSNPASVVVAGVNHSPLQFNNIQTLTYVDGFRLTCGGVYDRSDGLASVNAYGATTVVVLGAIEFGPTNGAHISVQGGALLSNKDPGSPWTITGGAPGNASIPGCFLFCYVSGNMIINSGGGPNISIPNPITLNGGFVYAIRNANSELVYGSLTGAGNVTGQRYNASYNSTIVTGSAGNPNYYPGTIAGTTATGGYYV